MSANRGKALGIMSITLALGVFSLEPGASQGGPKGRGDIVRSHREDKGGGNRPSWVDVAERRAKQHVRKHAERFGSPEVDRELKLRSAEEDDLGQTHVRLDQH